MIFPVICFIPLMVDVISGVGNMNGVVVWNKPINGSCPSEQYNFIVHVKTLQDRQSLGILVSSNLITVPKEVINDGRNQLFAAYGGTCYADEDSETTGAQIRLIDGFSTLNEFGIIKVQSHFLLTLNVNYPPKEFYIGAYASTLLDFKSRKNSLSVVGYCKGSHEQLERNILWNREETDSIVSALIQNPIESCVYDPGSIVVSGRKPIAMVLRAINSSHVSIFPISIDKCWMSISIRILNGMEFNVDGEEKIQFCSCKESVNGCPRAITIQKNLFTFNIILLFIQRLLFHTL